MAAVAGLEPGVLFGTQSEKNGLIRILEIHNFFSKKGKPIAMSILDSSSCNKILNKKFIFGGIWILNIQTGSRVEILMGNRD